MAFFEDAVSLYKRVNDAIKGKWTNIPNTNFENNL
jgi:hypothetical protein